MNKNQLMQEKISALMDGELAADEIDSVLSYLKTEEGRALWAAYHEAADAMKSEDLAIDMSAAFSIGLHARLAAEPTVMAPTVRTMAAGGGVSGWRSRQVWLPMAAAAAAAVVAFLITPQLTRAPESNVAANRHRAEAPTLVAVEGDALRDARLDAYMLAHEQFSPSLSSSAQYARVAAYSAGSDK